MNFNKVLIAGNLTRDPEMRYTPKGQAIAQIGIAVNRKWKNESGQEQEEVTFIDVTAWGKQAEVLAQYLKKGNPLFVEGRLKLDQWDDKKTGEKRSKIGVVLESFQFVGGKKETAERTPARQRPGPEDLPPNLKPSEEDSIPF